MATCLKGRIIESEEKLGREILAAGFGRRAENGVELNALEAAFLCERKIIEVHEGKKTLEVQEIYSKFDFGKKPKTGAMKKMVSKEKKSTKDAPKNTEMKTVLAEKITSEKLYLIYRALRFAGNVVRFSSGSPLMWRIYAKGVGREHERPQSILRIVDKDWQASLESLERELSVARLLRLELVLGYFKDNKPCLIKVSKPPIEV